MAEPKRVPAPIPQFPKGRFLIVEARYYEDVGAMLHAGASAALGASGAEVETIGVPGALEIPAAIAILVDAAAASGRPYDGVVALGCVIRGETYHFEIVAGESSRALIDLTVQRKLAIGNGVLTVENPEQAELRADPMRGDKGGDAARAALRLAELKRSAK
jgi:6,7-dimethyl-8-ribityllumazine synthase